MIQIDNTIFSNDLIEVQFNCDLSKCKGICCVLGDSGAPLQPDETDILDTIFEKIKPYLRKEAVAAIEKQGKWVIDSDNDMVTPLINGKECAYVIFSDDIALCAIEKAYNEGVVKFKKPISCHLYPVRIKQFDSFTAINYDKWDICKDAITKGKNNNSQLYVFLKEPLTRRFGKEWYKQLQYAASIEGNI